MIASFEGDNTLLEMNTIMNKDTEDLFIEPPQGVENKAVEVF